VGTGKRHEDQPGVPVRVCPCLVGSAAWEQWVVRLISRLIGSYEVIGKAAEAAQELRSAASLRRDEVTPRLIVGCPVGALEGRVAKRLPHLAGGSGVAVGSHGGGSRGLPGPWPCAPYLVSSRPYPAWPCGVATILATLTSAAPSPRRPSSCRPSRRREASRGSWWLRTWRATWSASGCRDAFND
jgi:hypothetical protein